MRHFSIGLATSSPQVVMLQLSPRKSEKSTAFHPLSTPTGLASSTPQTPSRFVFRALHWLVGLLLAFAVVAPIGYHVQAIYRNKLSVTWTPWFHVNPKDKSRYALGKEMLPAAYFFFFFVLPIFVTAFIFTLTKAHYRAGVSHWLHAQPACFRRVVNHGELLFLALILGGNILVFYHALLLQQSLNKPPLTAVAVALAFSGLYNLTFLALPATRHSFWLEWLNIPYNHAVKYHRWLGVATITCFGAHFLIFFIQFAKTDTLFDELVPCFDCNIAASPGGKDTWVNVFGELALLCMLIMGAMALPYVRRHYYSSFKLAHFLFVPATVFAVVHYDPIILWIFTAMVLYLVNRAYSNATTATPALIHAAVTLPANVTQLTFYCASTYHPGDIVYLNVPAISKTQWHPFSIASTPLHTPGLLTVYVKALGHWTTQLHAHMQQCTAAGTLPVVYVDTGYTPSVTMSPAYSSVVLVGGGIGVTPLLGQAMHALHARPDQDVYFIWHVKTLDMALQFQSWLHQLEAVAAAKRCRLHVRIHVTQQDCAEIAIEHDDDAPTASEAAAAAAYSSSATPRPITFASALRKLALLVLTFAISGALLYFVRYHLQIAGTRPKLWVLQRVVEYVVVVAGAVVAYVLTSVGASSSPADIASTTSPAPEPAPWDRMAFASHFNVQFERADWSKVFQTVQSERADLAPHSVGVYVSGPKALYAAVTDATTDQIVFDIHHEVFEL
ncbi:Aste57867_18415 [Aphanomyces stellatus]|uniref:Aste57867_18415 protein n=1 Tax=Aphanomyces stellatus TaxID=120398 RepID=A0A485LBH1_9STRA|nr:hypothetical protein As57867_018353 [Aphanomyces stellatus]VFT95151.1 Aste57867_18415 [Aphanomyces stellatus]